MKKTYRFSWLLLILVCALAVTSLADSIPSPVPSQHGWNIFNGPISACNYNFSIADPHACESLDNLYPCTLGGTHDEFHLGTNTLTFYIWQGNVSGCGYSFVQSHLFDENNSYRCTNCGKTPFGDKSA